MDQIASTPVEAVRTLQRAVADLDAAHPVATPEILSALTTLRQLVQQLSAWEPRLIGAARAQGASWAEIAPALGLSSRQAAERRYLRLNQQDAEPGLTGEQRVQATRVRRAGDRAVAGWARDNSATLRGLAGQVTALTDLDPKVQASVDRIHAALGQDDSAALLDPLAEAGARLKRSHPTLADRIAEIGANADEIRNATQVRVAQTIRTTDITVSKDEHRTPQAKEEDVP